MFSDSISYSKVNNGKYISYPGYQFTKIGVNNFSISYTDNIITPYGTISTDNIQNLVFSDLPTGDFGILPSNTSYSNRKPNNTSPLFKLV